MVEKLKQLDLALLHSPEPDEVGPDLSNRLSALSLNDIGLMAARDGQHARAINYFRKAIQKSPEHAFIYSNYALSLRDLGFFADAIRLLEYASTLDNKNTVLLFNLANLKFEIGQLREAMVYYDEAVRLNATFPDLYCNYSLAALEAQEYALALRLAQRGFEITAEDGPFYGRFVIVLATLDSIMGDNAAGLARLETLMARNDAADVLLEYVRLLSIASPSDLSTRSLGFLRLALEEQWSAPEQFIHAAWVRLVADFGLPDSPNNPDWPRLADLLLASALVPDLETESWLVYHRKALFSRATNVPLSEREVDFYSALAQQCFLRNYLFAPEEAETYGRMAWQDAIAKSLEAGTPVDPLPLLQLACSAPLHRMVVGAERLTYASSLTPPLIALVQQQVENPLREREIEPTISVLSRCHDALDPVAARYREYPYPQWTWPGRLHRPERFNVYLAQRLGHSTFIPLNAASIVRILVAGCGTGRHSHLLARTVTDGAITAIDISRPSLAFAKRQALADGITNVDYIEADLTQLEAWGECFDVIECAGVLHHLPDPDEGLRILLKLLKSGGMIMLALYSCRARKPIQRLRERLSLEDPLDLEVTLHHARKLVIEDTDLQTIASFREFYTLNECADLILHPREVSYTPVELKAMLERHGLIFRGFELTSPQRNLFRMRYRRPNDLFDLDLWDSYEAENPNMFAGMYHLWAQKPA